MANRTRKPKFLWSDYTKAEQKTLLDLIGHDGHTIWSAKGLIEEGVNPHIIAAFTQDHKSDGSLKGSIEVDGRYVDGLSGVYGLTVLRSLAGYYNESSDKLGRGFEASELTTKIYKHLS